MKKAMKKVLVAVLSALMLLGSFVIPAAADDDEFQACVEGQFDTSFEGNFDEWADLKADYTMTLKKDGLVTYKADYGQKVKFSGNYVGLNTNVPVEKDADDKVINKAGLVSVKLDGVEVAIADPSLLTEEGLDSGVRINLTNQWNGDITTQPIDPQVWADTEFQVIEIEFYVGDYEPANKVCVEGQFDTSYEGNFDEWADLKADYTMDFAKNGTVTYTADYGQKVKFSGNYVGLNTSVPVVKDADDKVINDAALVSVKLDGVEVEIADPSLLTAEGIDGGVRINLTNQWNGDITTQPIAPEVWETAFQVIEVQFYINDTDAPAPGGDEEPSEDEPSESDAFDASSKDYFAQLFVQFDGAWAFRNPYSDGTYGGSAGYPDCDALIAWVDTDGDGTTDAVPHEGAKFEDAKLLGNGTYSIKFTSDTLPEGCTAINLIGISTNIPASAVDIVKFTNVKIIVNNMVGTAYTYSEGTADPDTDTFINILGVNKWNSEVCADANALFADAANWPAEGVSSIEIQFTVSGFSYDKAAEGDNNGGEGTTTAPTTEAAKEEKEGGLSTGALIAIIAGCVAVVAVIVVVVVVSSKKKKAN